MTVSDFERPLLAADVPPHGKTVTVEMSPAECAEIAELLELPRVDSIRADLKVRPFGDDGLEVVGMIVADLAQTCVVSLESFDVHAEIAVDIRFSPDGVDPFDEDGSIEDLLAEDGAEPPDKLVDGKIDLGHIVYEFLALGLDPYPRKPGVDFETTDDGKEAGPFAALRALKQDR